MYALIDLTRTRKRRSARHYETLPDGRIIVPISELRAFGTTSNVDIVATATELKQIIEIQKEQPTLPDAPPEDTAPQEGENPDDTQTDGTATEGDANEGGTEAGGGDTATGDLQENQSSSAEEEIMPIDEEQNTKKGGRQ